MNKNSKIVIVLFCLYLVSCNFPSIGNTVREYKTGKFMLNVDQMEIVSKRKAKSEITGLILNLVDSNTKTYKNYLISVSFDSFPDRYSLATNQSLMDSIRMNYSKIILETDDSHIWYSVKLSPRDWLKGSNIFFIENVR